MNKQSAAAFLVFICLVSVSFAARTQVTGIVYADTAWSDTIKATGEVTVLLAILYQ